MCLEFARPGDEYAWREQMIFHGIVDNERFDHANIHIKPGQNLEDGDMLCTSGSDSTYLTDGGIELVDADGPDLHSVNFIHKGDRKMEIEFKR